MSLALLSLFLAAFSIGTTEFVIAGLLPNISVDLGVSVPTAGLLVSGYAIGVAVGGPILSILTSRFERKTAILLLMSIFIVGQAFCALAPSYPVLMAARIFVSLSHGSFFGVGAIVAVSIAKKGGEGRAISMMFAGITVANILGVPGGTAIGNMLGWRATFWAVGAIAVLATSAMMVFLPRATARHQAPSFAAQVAVLGRHQVWLSYLIIIFMMLAFWTTFTFVAPLAEAAGIPNAYIPIALLMFGVGSTIGVVIGGRLADWSLTGAMLVGFPLQIIAYVVLYLLSGNSVGTAVMLCILGIVGFLVGAGVQNRVLRGAADAPDLASPLSGSAFNVGIAGGAGLGAWCIGEGFAYGTLPLVSAFLILGVVGLSLIAAMLDSRDNEPTAAQA